MSGFPLAKERMRQEMSSSHTARNMGLSVYEILRSHADCNVQFCCCYPPLPDLPHSPTFVLFNLYIVTDFRKQS